MKAQEAAVTLAHLLGWKEGEYNLWIDSRPWMDDALTDFRVAEDWHDGPDLGYWNPVRSYNQVIAAARALKCSITFNWKGKHIIVEAESHGLTSRGKAEWDWNGNFVAIEVLIAHARAVQKQIQVGLDPEQIDEALGVTHDA